MHNKKHPLGCSLGYIFKFSVLNGKTTPTHYNFNTLDFDAFIRELFRYRSAIVNFKIKTNGWAPDSSDWIRGTVYLQNINTDYITVGDIVVFGELSVHVAKIIVLDGNIGVKRWVKIADIAG